MNNDVRRIAIVTGGSSGIGLEFAKLFSRDGYSVVIVARNEQQLINAKSEILERTILQMYILYQLISLCKIRQMFCMIRFVVWGWNMWMY